VALVVLAITGWQIASKNLTVFGVLPGAGPLRALQGGGGVSQFPPAGRVNWWGTFGIELCATRHVTVTKVEPHWHLRPVDYRVVMRNVSNRSDDRIATSPIASSPGLAPKFAEPYANKHPPTGRMMTDLLHADVKVGCYDEWATGSRFTELLVSVRSDAAGADLYGLTIHYRSGRHRYTAEVTGWEMIMCGTRIRDQACDGYLEPDA